MAEVLKGTLIGLIIFLAVYFIYWVFHKIFEANEKLNNAVDEDGRRIEDD